MRALGLLFGSTAKAAALSIEVFVAGIALGGWLFARIARRLSRPLGAFGWVEVGVGLTAFGICRDAVAFGDTTNCLRSRDGSSAGVSKLAPAPSG